MAFTGNEHHDITFATGATMTKAYRMQMTAGQIKGGFFGATAIRALLAQPNCVGIRYYYGLDSNGNQTMVLVGTDANENDLVDPATNLCMDTSIPCPNRCGNNNMLNS